MKKPLHTHQTQSEKSSLPPSSSHQNFRSAYGPKLKVTLDFKLPSRTKQSFKDECDINLIMARYEKTGLLEHINRGEPQYADLSELDFMSAMNMVAEAREVFAALPSKLRDRFANDPARLLAFLDNEDNRAEAITLGLVPPPPAAATPPATPPAKAPDAPPTKPETPPADKKG